MLRLQYMLPFSEYLLRKYDRDFVRIAREVVLIGEKYCREEQWQKLDELTSVALELNLEEGGPTRKRVPLIDIIIYLGLLEENIGNPDEKSARELDDHRASIFKELDAKS